MVHAVDTGSRTVARYHGSLRPLDGRRSALVRFAGPCGSDPGSSRGKEVSPTCQFINALIASFRNDEEGQGLAEYALILALIAIVAIIALIFLGSQVSTILTKVGSSI